MLDFLLSCVIDNLQPEGKYLLLRLYQRSVDDEKTPVSFRELASRYRLSVAHVSDALDVLVSSRVLVSTDVKGGPGRSKKRYALDVKLLERISAAELPLSVGRVRKVGGVRKYSGSGRSSASTQHLPDIARLLAHEDRELDGVVAGEREDARDLLAAVRARRRIGGISVVNRLLLAVMLLHADQFGVVRDIGSAALQEMTCLSSGRLKHRIARLIEIGVIKAYVPGAARSALFNKTSSVYFLNLDHPELSAGTSFTKVRVYKKKVGMSGVDLRVANQMLNDAVRFRDDLESVAVDSFRPRHIAGPFQAERQSMEPLQRGAVRFRDDLESVTGYSFRFKCIAEIFQAEPQSMYPLLQLRLESYAAHLMSKYGSTIHLLADHMGFQAHVDAELKTRIRADVSRSKALAGIDRATAAFTGNAFRDSLEDELYVRARDLALSIYLAFDGEPDSSMDLMDFVIVPQAGELGAHELELLAISRSI